MVKKLNLIQLKFAYKKYVGESHCLKKNLNFYQKINEYCEKDFLSIQGDIKKITRI